ncbi:MAG: ABC transporter ATP-binding protein [Acidimicrobiia bacterium]
MKTKIVQTAGSAPSPVEAAEESVIHAAGLAKSFGEVSALSPLDLSVPRHSIFGFLGPNGAGKTTTIKLLLGLSRPSAGRATGFGLDSVKDSLEIRSRIGYLAQDPRFYSHMTARETLEFTARFFYRGPAPAIRDRIDETLELVGLEDKADRPTKGFSGGERQRLGIAQAQINHPDLLILDEPAAALDPVGRRDVLEVMERLRAYTTIFYSTHILDDVQRVSDRVAILDEGKLVASARTEDLLDGDTATFELSIRGDERAVATAIEAQPWVSDVKVVQHESMAIFSIHVTDETAAEARLLRLVLATGDTTVTAFGRKHFNLEDVFLQLVKGNEE